MRSTGDYRAGLRTGHWRSSSMTNEPIVTNRKVIHAAGVLLVQPDAELGEAWRAALVDFGMAGAHVAADSEAAVASIRARRPSGIVIALETQIESHDLMARLASGECGDLADIPVVLVMARPTRSAVIAAASAGFDAVLPFPLAPRLIYRRMGSLMQKARRAARLKAQPHPSLASVLQGETGLS
jgi:DNA-binding response OmpR family regulator